MVFASIVFNVVNQKRFQLKEYHTLKNLYLLLCAAAPTLRMPMANKQSAILSKFYYLKISRSQAQEPTGSNLISSNIKMVL